MRNGKTVPFFAPSFVLSFCFRAVFWTKMLLLCKDFLCYGKKRITENPLCMGIYSKNAANAAFCDWSITTKPMHTALFFKIEPDYFVFG